MMIQKTSKGQQKIITRRELLQSSIALALMFPKARALPAENYFPQGNQWETCAAKDAGMDAAMLEAAGNYAAEHNSSGLIVLRGGRLILEKYWLGWTSDYTQPIFSASKSIISTLIGMAIEERKLRGIEQSMADFVPAWKGTSKQEINLRHVLTMTSGIKNV